VCPNLEEFAFERLVVAVVDPALETDPVLVVLNDSDRILGYAVVPTERDADSRTTLVSYRSV